jgi:N-acetylneuraminic acid mutarotase
MSPRLRRPLVAVAGASIVCLGTSNAVATVSAQGGPLRWAKAAPFPQPEEERYGTVVNGKVYVLGGCMRPLTGQGANGWEPVDNAWEYDPAADSWRALAPMPGKRCAAIAEEVGGKLS